MTDLDALGASFAARFGSQPTVVVRAPGRVNLIGEHTDTTGGLVLPFAIEPSIWVAAAPAGNTITAYSEAMDHTIEWPVDGSRTTTPHRWGQYVGGVIAELRAEGIPVSGTSLWIGGDLPIGRGLASSAALCVAMIQALLRLYRPSDHRLETGATRLGTRLEMAHLVQRVERDHVGTPCGLMDPYVCLFGRRDHALLLDCRTDTHEYVPMTLPGFRWMLIDTGITHELASGAYAQRVAECNAATEAITKIAPGVRSLRDLTPQTLERYAPHLNTVLARRARHIVSENERVRRSVAALGSSDADRVGACLEEGHRSLCDQFEVSTPEIEQLQKIVSRVPGVVGVRLVGGGFGGSLLALVRRQNVSDLRAMLMKLPSRAHPHEGGLLEVGPAAGAVWWAR
ncbi:MAG: galactokinase [Planctomycetes bacterium]|nr:galactokinase [Planctomycetota bacterium]